MLGWPSSTYWAAARGTYARQGLARRASTTTPAGLTHTTPSDKKTPHM